MTIVAFTKIQEIHHHLIAQGTKNKPLFWVKNAWENVRRMKIARARRKSAYVMAFVECPASNQVKFTSELEIRFLLSSSLLYFLWLYRSWMPRAATTWTWYCHFIGPRIRRKSDLYLSNRLQCCWGNLRIQHFLPTIFPNLIKFKFFFSSQPDYAEMVNGLDRSRFALKTVNCIFFMLPFFYINRWWI